MDQSKITLIGRVGRVRPRTQVGTDNVISMSVAVNGGTKENPTVDWHQVDFWNAAVWVDKLASGAQVMVEGKPSVEVFKNKAGQMVGAIKVRASYVNQLQAPSSKPSTTPSSN